MLQYQIALTLLPNVGPKLGRELVAYCGGVEAVFREKTSRLIKIPGIGKELSEAIPKQKVLDRAIEETEFLEKNKIKPLFYLSKDFPSRLKHCADAPLMLYYKGNANLDSRKVVSIIGTRKATEYGKMFCKQLVQDLSAHEDILILSGLAYGIDSCAHRASLDRSVPTVAVMGHSLDRVYPPANHSLAAKMLEKGGLLSEFVSDTKPDRENFPRRNRVVAGMSDAVVVVESGKKGGALITADIANSYNRDVFAVPGRLNDTYSEGCNNLIKTNRAALIESAEDINYIMGWTKEKSKKHIQRKLFTELNPEEELIVKVLQSKGTIAIDDLILETRMGATKIASSLLNLEFSGVIKCMPGKVYCLID
ncbi:MAG TPA: DNA-processing protein DprA [Bacteroidales bacterium]|nr:DNA-processing protein DprA [Bacteroidales bacterium]